MVDNTSEFIEVVKKYDIVYNTRNPNYKNFLEKLNAWSQIAEELGLTVDAAKRKWKNLRDSYTKYLRSFRAGTKTSKKYQFWAHADHMDFLKPHQGPGRTISKTDETDENDSDIGFQVLKKVTTPEDGELIAPTPPITHPPTSTIPITTKVHIQPSIIMAKNVANGFITQIPMTPLDTGTTPTHQTTAPPIVAKIRAIPTPANHSISCTDVTSSPPTKIRKTTNHNGNADNLDVASVLRANRELDATCLFFLSLAKSVRSMPKRYQAMVKMRCMRIISDVEMEIESNLDGEESGAFYPKFQNGQHHHHHQYNNCGGGPKNTDTVENSNSDSNSQAVSGGQPTSAGNENSEHFLYVMSPSRVEAMIDVSSEDEATNGTN